MSEPVDASTITSGRPPARAASAAISTITALVDDSGTPRNPDGVSAEQLDPHDGPVAVQLTDLDRDRRGRAHDGGRGTTWRAP